MIIDGNGQQIQVCNLLILNTKNVAWLNWHVVRHLTKNIEISPKKILGGWQLCRVKELGTLPFTDHKLLLIVQAVQRYC